ncbi:MAG: hypothetical protein J0M04_25385 [Verrucomicrobia bacterium]|nr:hypothetical protein [Verrucomicrobiota bacterium]
MRTIFPKRKITRICLGVYLGLWLLTATIGNHQVNRKFDEDFGFGTVRPGSADRVRIVRIRNLDVRDPDNPRNDPLIPENGLFRQRSWGIAIAPFVIVDEVATVFAPLGGFGGLRVNVWFFGYVRSVPVYPYWHV